MPVSLSQINKAQGQTFQHIGIYLPRPVFMHRQLYVAVSRVGECSGLRIMVTHDRPASCPDDGHNYTLNVVYKEVFEGLLDGK